MLKRAVGIALVATLLIAGLVYSQKRTGPLKVSGFIESDEIRLGSRVGGRVRRVLVEEGDRVRKDQVLVELEPYQLLEQRAEAQAVLRSRRAELDRLQSGFRVEEIAQSKARYDKLSATLDKLVNGPRKEEIAAAQAQLEQADAELKLATVKHRRTETLLATKAVTSADMDQATSELRVAEARQRVRIEELSELQSGTRPEELAEARAQLDEASEAWLLQKNGYRKEDVAGAAAAVEAAEAALQTIERQIEELTIKAQVSGIIDAIELRPGDLVAANTTAVSVIDESRMWVRAYVPENHLNLRIGDKVSVAVDSFPARRFTARISYVSRQGEFTPGNVQTPEERSKQVFRIKAMIEDGRDLLRPGMAADVWLAPEGAP